MSKEYTIEQWIKHWDNNSFTNTTDSMIDAGWYDWVCDNEELYNKTQTFIPTIKKLDKFIDTTSHIMFFKNCDCYSGDYDIIGILDKNENQKMTIKFDYQFKPFFNFNEDVIETLQSHKSSNIINEFINHILTNYDCITNLQTVELPDGTVKLCFNGKKKTPT